MCSKAKLSPNQYRLKNNYEELNNCENRCFSYLKRVIAEFAQTAGCIATIFGEK